jgi:hypothetical protein
MKLSGSLPYSQELSLIPILSRINPVHTLTPYFFKIHFNIILQVLYVQYLYYTVS